MKQIPRWQWVVVAVAWALVVPSLAYPWFKVVTVCDNKTMGSTAGSETLCKDVALDGASAVSVKLRCHDNDTVAKVTAEFLAHQEGTIHYNASTHLNSSIAGTGGYSIHLALNNTSHFNYSTEDVWSQERGWVNLPPIEAGTVKITQHQNSTATNCDVKLLLRGE